MPRVLLLLPTQLYDPSHVRGYSKIIVVEDPFYLNPDYHIQKLYLHITTTRAYVSELRSQGLRVVHKQYHEVQSDRSAWYASLLTGFDVYGFDPIDRVMVSLYSDLRVNVLESLSFICSRSDLDDYDSQFSNRMTRSMIDFYKWQRTRLNILMTHDGNPVGGKWSYDSSNRSRYANDYLESHIKENALDPTIVAYISKHFPNAIGVLRSMYPSTRAQAMTFVRKSIRDKLMLFGKYQDAISSDVIYGNHMNISALINIGLVAPRLVIECIIRKYRDVMRSSSHEQDLIYIRNSAEGLIRQLIGWREYIRYMYYRYRDAIIRGSSIRGSRTLPRSWYTAATGSMPIDRVISKCLNYAYLHHIERLMLVNNIMVLEGIRYRDVLRWFMRMFIDSYDWVMTPNIMMNTNSSNTAIRYMTRLYICSSSYIKKMSNRGYLDSDTSAYLDARYQKFMLSNQDVVSRDYMMASSLKRIKSGSKK